MVGDDKDFDNDLVKILKTLRNMPLVLVQKKNPIQMNNLAIIRFLMMDKQEIFQWYGNI